MNYITDTMNNRLVYNDQRIVHAKINSNNSKSTMMKTNRIIAKSPGVPIHVNGPHVADIVSSEKRQMMDFYSRLQANGNKLNKPAPNQILVINEADITDGETLSNIASIARLGRTAGIHLVLVGSDEDNNKLEAMNSGAMQEINANSDSI